MPGIRITSATWGFLPPPPKLSNTLGDGLSTIATRTGSNRRDAILPYIFLSRQHPVNVFDTVERRCHSDEPLREALVRIYGSATQTAAPPCLVGTPSIDH